MDGGEGAARILSDIFDGGRAETNFSDCNMDGGAVVHGKTCGCCPSDGGEGVAIMLQDTIDGGGA
jgi:hypothetical protein